MNIYNLYKKRLGMVCRNINFAETIISEYRKIIKENENELKKIKATQLNFQDLNYDAEHKKIYLNNIVSIQSIFEIFLKEDVIEFIKKNAKNKLFEKEKSDSYLMYCIKSLRIKSIKNEEICEYYRLVRNCYLHTSNKIPKLSSDLVKEGINRYEDINFNDFKIFSQATREIIYEIYLKIELDYEKIFIDNINKFEFYRNNKEKFRKKYREFMKHAYGEKNFEKIDIDKLFEILNGP